MLASPLVAVAFLAVLTPSDDVPTFCPFALCTGMACPGCGMTRPTSYLIRGEIATGLPLESWRVPDSWLKLLMDRHCGTETV